MNFELNLISLLKKNYQHRSPLENILKYVRNVHSILSQCSLSLMQVKPDLQRLNVRFRAPFG